MDRDNLMLSKLCFKKQEKGCVGWPGIGTRESVTLLLVCVFNKMQYLGRTVEDNLIRGSAMIDLVCLSKLFNS